MADVVSGTTPEVRTALFQMRSQLSIAVQTVTDKDEKRQLQAILADVQAYLNTYHPPPDPPPPPQRHP